MLFSLYIISLNDNNKRRRQWAAHPEWSDTYVTWLNCNASSQRRDDQLWSDQGPKREWPVRLAYLVHGRHHIRINTRAEQTLRARVHQRSVRQLHEPLSARFEPVAKQLGLQMLYTVRWQDSFVSALSSLYIRSAADYDHRHHHAYHDCEQWRQLVA